MPYCTTQDLIDRFGEVELVRLTDRTGTEALDDVVLGQVIADADAQIDGYLRIRYPLPLLSVPPELKRIACDIARYALYDDQLPDVVEQRYAACIDYLKALSAGKVALDSAVVSPALAEEAAAAAEGSPASGSRLAVFTTETLGQMP